MSSGREHPRSTTRPAGSGRGAGVPVGPLAAGVLALLATVVVLATDNPVQLRVGLLAVCWAAVVAVFVVTGRRADRLAAERRELALRHAHELELQREAATRRSADLAVENELRRESEQGMRDELARLRKDLAVLAGAAGDPAGVSQLRDGLADLAQLRAEITALTELRAELSGLSGLRDDLGRIRAELTDQRSGELMVERMVMRTQSVRLPADRDDSARVVEGPATRMWETTRIESDQWPEQWDQTRIERVLPAVEGRPAVEGARPAVPPAAAPQPSAHRRPPVPPSARTPEPTTVVQPAVVPPAAEPVVAAQPVVTAQPAVAAQPAEAEAAADRPTLTPLQWLVQQSVVEPWVESRPKSPLEWLSEQSLVDAGPATAASTLPTEEPVAEESSPAPAPSPASWRPEPAATTPEQAAPRRHRRAAEPDDEPVAPQRPRRSHAAPETAVGLDLSPYRPAPDAEETPRTVDESPAWAASWSAAPWTPEVAQPAVPQTPAAPSWSTGTSYTGPAWADADPAPAATSWSGAGSTSWETPSGAEPSWETPSWETPSWETPSWESTAAAADDWSARRRSRAAESPAADTRNADAGSDQPAPSWTAPSWTAPSWTDGAPAAGSHRGDVDEVAGHARLAEILAQNEPKPAESGRRRRRYREEDDAAGDDVLARVLGRS